jgi:hypothetical protein
MRHGGQSTTNLNYCNNAILSGIVREANRGTSTCPKGGNGI